MKIGGLTRHIKGLSGYAAGRWVFCCPQYRNWQSLVCNEALNGGGGFDVYLGGDDPINIHERTFIYSSAYATTEYLRESVGRVHVEN